MWLDLDDKTKGKIIGFRFGIYQGQRTMVMDDLSVCRINSTVGLRERYILHTVDKLAAILSHLFYEFGGVPDLRGRTYDLTAAYKQYGINKESRNFIRLALRKPGSTA